MDLQLVLGFHKERVWSQRGACSNLVAAHTARGAQHNKKKVLCSPLSLHCCSSSCWMREQGDLPRAQQQPGECVSPGTAIRKMCFLTVRGETLAKGLSVKSVI